MSKHRHFCQLSSLLAACLASIGAGLAEEEIKYVDVIERGAFFRSKHFAPVYDKRISNIREQIELAVTKGWMSSDEGERLKSECTRLTANASGMPAEPVQSQVDEMERALTRLNSDVQQAMHPSSSPAASAAPSSPVVPASTGADSFSGSSSASGSSTSGTAAPATTSSASSSSSTASSSSSGGSNYGMGASAAGVVPMKSIAPRKTAK